MFHAKEFKQRRGEFEGWEDGKWQYLTNSLAEFVHRRLTEGVTVHLPRERYLNQYRDLPFPQKMQPDSQYGLCFRVCLDHLSQMVGVRGGKRPTLHIIIEAGHKNVGSTQSIFNELKKWMARRGDHVPGTMKIAQKSESVELLVADFLAHTYSMMRASNPSLLQQAPHQSSPENRPRGTAGLTYLDFTDETFADLKDIFAREKHAAMDDSRAKHAAKCARTASLKVSAG